jgi:hypothetical protein
LKTWEACYFYRFSASNRYPAHRREGKPDYSSGNCCCKKNGSSMVPEVCIYFDFELYRGNRAVKRDADLFSAFRSVNYPALAIAGVDIKYRKEFIQYPEP